MGEVAELVIQAILVILILNVFQIVQTPAQQESQIDVVLIIGFSLAQIVILTFVMNGVTSRIVL